MTGLLIGLVLLCLALAVYALSRSTDNATPESSPPTITSLPATLPVTDQTDAFLDAYENSFSGPYVVSGVLEFANDRAITRQEIRRARIGDRWLDQVGGGALVGRDGELRRCSDDGSQFLCTDPEPEPTLSERRSEMAQDLLDGDGFTVSKSDGGTCFVLTAIGDGTFSPFGFETTYCFDDATGAVASKVTVKGARTESFTASSIGSEVTEADLAPK